MIRLFLICFLSIFLIGCSSENKNSNDAVQSEIKTIQDEINQNEPKKSVIKYDKSLFGGKTVDEYYDIRCASCHGRYAQKKALKASKILNTLSSNEIKLDLIMYKNDQNYGGNLKATMQNLAKNLSDDEIEVLSEYIPTL